MGSLFRLPVLRVETGGSWLQEIQAMGVETFASVCGEGELLTEAAASSEKMALLLGSEAFGLPPEVVDACHRSLCIPMPGGVDSFSVNAAAAILSYGLLHPGS
jgi:TrmH family RNA methyltransferase